jgi:hypothetical protein
VVSSIPKTTFPVTLPSIRRSGAFSLIDSLQRHGVKHIFGYPGGAILPIYDELYFNYSVRNVNYGDRADIEADYSKFIFNIKCIII